MGEPLDLGCFSVSLAVSDLDKSVAFYEALGFSVLGGEGGYRILGNGLTKLGLFAEHIDENILTFNPGLAQEFARDVAEGEAEPGLPEPVEGFTDVRAIEARLREAGIELDRSTETDEGPDHVMLTDPDGNKIMIDQFF